MDISSNDPKFSGLGVASLVFGIFALTTCGLFFLSYSYFSLSFFITIPLNILSITFGSVSYWGKSKDKTGLLGFILGIIALAVVIIYLYYQILSPPWYY